MWWRLFVLVLYIVVIIIIIIIILQQFDDVDALQSPIFIQSSQLFFWTLSDGLSCWISKIS